MKVYNWQEKIKEDELEEVVKILNQGGIIIFPTDTVFGMGGNALNDEVVKKIYQIKNRSLEKHFNIIVKDKADLKKYGQVKSILEQRIIDNLMPGALTIILDTKVSLRNYSIFQNSDIGIRIPENKIILEILKRIDYPLIATSANKSGESDQLLGDDLKKIFAKEVDAFCEGEIISVTLPSTIVKIKDEQVIILREGNISRDKVMDVCKISK